MSWFLLIFFSDTRKIKTETAKKKKKEEEEKEFQTPECLQSGPMTGFRCSKNIKCFKKVFLKMVFYKIFKNGFEPPF